MTRRTFIKFAVASSVTSTGMVGFSQAAPRRVQLTRHLVPWPSRHRLRVAHLTDLHLGWGTPNRLIDQGLHLCEQAKPDLVVLTGDYVNRTLKHLPELSRILRRFPRPCLATLGNHDHWSGAYDIQETFEQQGIAVLRNANTRLKIGNAWLQIVGVDDGVTKHDNVEQAFRGVHAPETTLVLSHYPGTVERIARCGGRVILSGHTHGGQIEVPILTKAIARLAGNRYLSGWYSLSCTQLYVNAGIGSAVVRVRVGRRATPEVAIFDFF